MDVCKIRYLFVLILSLIAGKIFGQSDYLNKDIYLKTGSIRLDSAFTIISKQTGVVFSYNPKKINARQKIYLKASTKKLSHFLDLLSREKKFSVKAMENHIVVTSPVKTEAIGANVQLEAIDTKKSNHFKGPVIATTKSVVSSAFIKKDTLIISSKPDSTIQLVQPETVPSKITTADTIKGVQQTENKTLTDTTVTRPRIISAIKDTTRKVVRLPKVPFKEKLFFKSGLTADESSFMGLVVQGGLPGVYATLSGNSNLLVFHFRYGAGASIKLNPKLRLHFIFNDGNVSRSGFFSDSLGTRFPIAVKSNLARWGVGLEFKLKNKLSLQVIPVFNRLNTHYFINNLSSDLSLFKNEGDRLFYALRSPYFLTNTFSPTSSTNTKTWVGLQVSFLYRINFY